MSPSDMSGRVRDTRPTTDRTDKVRIGVSDVRRPRTSPLVAALAEAVVEQRDKRAGLVAEVVGNVGGVEPDDGAEVMVAYPAHHLAERPALVVIPRGRRAQPEP